MKGIMTGESSKLEQGVPTFEYKPADALEAEGKIQAYPPAERRRKRKGEVTFADGVRVELPPRGA